MFENEINNKERQILLAAEVEFMEKGFDGARTTSIAKAAGVTHAMLHYYFRTKEQLFEKIIKSKMEPAAIMILSALGNRDLPLEERIKDGISAHFDFLMENPSLPKFILNTVFLNENLAEIFESMMLKMLRKELDYIQNEIDERVKKKEVRYVNSQQLFISIVSLNVFSFIALPIVKSIYGSDFNESFFSQRKDENIELIMRRLKP